MLAEVPPLPTPHQQADCEPLPGQGVRPPGGQPERATDDLPAPAGVRRARRAQRADARRATTGVWRGGRRRIAYLILTGLGILLVATIVVVVTSLSGTDRSSSPANAAASKLPPYWVVRRGDTYAQIADKTGLTVEQLETFNPYTDPRAITPGRRLKLRLHIPRPAPKPKGPRYWTVRRGQTISSIARKTGHAIIRLQQLNRNLKPTALQPGDRLRLRR